MRGRFFVLWELFQYLRKIILIVGIGRKRVENDAGCSFLEVFLVVAMRVIVLLI